MQRRQIFGKALEHFQYGFLVRQEHIAPHHRVGRGDAGKIAKAASRIFDDLGLGHTLQIAGGADDGIGNQVRQVAGNREHQIVMPRVHDLDIGTQRLPENLEALDRELRSAFRRGQYAPAALKQCRKARVWSAFLGTGNRMRRNDRRPRQGRRQRLGDALLARADIAHHGIGGQIVGNRFANRAHDTHRYAQHDQIGVDDRATG